MLDAIWHSISSNPIFSGGVLAGATISVFHAVKGYPLKLLAALARRFKLRVVIHSDDRSFEDVITWLKSNNFDKNARAYRLRTTPKAINVGPDYGSYLFKALNNKWYYVSVTKDAANQGAEAKNQTRDFISITCLSLSKDRFTELTQELHLLKEDKSKKSVDVYTWWEWWNFSRTLSKSENSNALVMTNGDMQELDEDVINFFNSKEKYNNLGIPYRRGYLLYGPPGTGKTSYIKHIAMKTGRDLYIIKASALIRSDSLEKALASMKEGCIVAIEDIDGGFIKFESMAPKAPANDPLGQKPVQEDRAFNLTEVLNSLDGITTPEGSIIIATTNKKESLDAALIRPGRFDVHKRIGLCSKEQAGRLFKKWFPNEDSKEFEDNIEHDTISPATLQGLLIKAKNKEHAISLAKELY